MKKKTIVALVLAMTLLAGCGAKEPKVIGGDSSKSSVKTESTVASSDSSAQSGSSVEETGNEGYVFTCAGGSVTTDMPIEDALAVLGADYTKFEARSCAFDGITEFYTYANVELDTYPDGDINRLCTIVFLNDLVSTAEGVCIGDGVTKLDEVYGENYEGDSESRTYKKGDTQLMFIVSDGKIISIQYRSGKF